MLSIAVSATAASPSPDFNNDVFNNLVVGVPNDRDFSPREGAVNFIKGTSIGLSASGNQGRKADYDARKIFTTMKIGGFARLIRQH